MLCLCIGSVRTNGECYNTFLTLALWTFQATIQLEKELAYLGSVCAAALMKKDLALPIGMEKQWMREFAGAVVNNLFFYESMIQVVCDSWEQINIVNSKLFICSCNLSILIYFRQ